MVNKDKEKYECLIEEINILFHKKDDYKGCLVKTNEFLELIQKEQAPIQNFRFAYGTLSKVYNKLGEKELSIKYILMAENCLTKDDDYTRHIVTKWQIGIAYKGVDNDKALEYLRKSYMMSTESLVTDTPNYEYMGSIIEEIALITRNPNDLLKGILFYTKAETTRYIDKVKSLDNMYKNLFELYYEKGDMVSAMKIIHNVKNKDIITELKKKIFRIA